MTGINQVIDKLTLAQTGLFSALPGNDAALVSVGSTGGAIRRQRSC